MNINLKRKIVVAAMIALGSLVLTVPLFAESNDSSMEMHHKRKGDKDIMKMLNLSPAQKEQVQNQRSANKQKWSELKEKTRSKRLELKQELEKPEIDKNKINAITADIKTLMGEQIDLRIDDILAMKRILTPEQFKKLQERKSGYDTMYPKAKQ